MSFHLGSQCVKGWKQWFICTEQQLSPPASTVRPKGDEFEDVWHKKSPFSLKQICCIIVAGLGNLNTSTTVEIWGNSMILHSWYAVLILVQSLKALCSYLLWGFTSEACSHPGCVQTSHSEAWEHAQELSCFRCASSLSSQWIVDHAVAYTLTEGLSDRDKLFTVA